MSEAKKEAKKMRIQLRGMTCASCAQKIENQLNKLPGVNNATVNFNLENAYVEYNSKITWKGKRGAQEIIEITSLPKKNAAVVWGKLKLIVRQKDFIPLQILYYKENMKLGRTMNFFDVKKIDGRLRPLGLKVIPADKPKEMTLVHYPKVKYDLEVSDRIFSIPPMGRIGVVWQRLQRHKCSGGFHVFSRWRIDHWLSTDHVLQLGNGGLDGSAQSPIYSHKHQQWPAVEICT